MFVLVYFLDNGGIYLDTDIIAVRSFDSLRVFPATLGRETSYGLGSGIIVAQRHSAFLRMWLDSFADYRPWPWNWAKYAVWTPHALARQHPSDVHIEVSSLQHPTWAQSDLLCEGLYDWSDNFAVHVWKRFCFVPENPEEIDSLNTTLGEVMRYVYYGSKRLRTSNTGAAIRNSHLRRSIANSVDVYGHKLLEWIKFNN